MESLNQLPPIEINLKYPRHNDSTSSLMKTYLTDQCIEIGFKADRLTMKPKEKLMNKRLYQVKTKYDTNGDVSLFKKYMTKLDNDGYIYQKYAKKSKGGSFFNGKKLDFVIEDSNALSAYYSR